MSVSTKDAYSQMFAKFPDVVSITQLSQMLHISEKLAYRLIRENQIDHLKIGRTYKIPKINVIRYLGILDQTTQIKA